MTNGLFVPWDKDSEFAKALFETLSENLARLKMEHGKWPDSLIFHGRLGLELFEFINMMGWNLNKFNPSTNVMSTDRITYEYTKPLSQIEDRGGTIFDKSLSDTTVNGIPGVETVAKIKSAYSGNLAYTIERTVRPKLETKLIRK